MNPDPTQALSKLIEYLQRMQASYRKLGKGAEISHRPEEKDESALIVSVLGDVIRLAAELRAGDGSRAALTPKWCPKCGTETATEICEHFPT